MNSSLAYTDTTTPSVSDLAGIASATGVVQSRMSPEAREDAIVRAHALVEYFQAERDLYEALRARSTVFWHRGDADRAKVNWRRAVDILASLLAGRNQGAKE